MPEKQKTHSWTKIQTAIATSAMLGLLALFNVIASLDRHKVNTDPGVTPTSPVPSSPALKSLGLGPVSNLNNVPVSTPNLIPTAGSTPAPVTTSNVTRTRSS